MYMDDARRPTLRYVHCVSPRNGCRTPLNHTLCVMPKKPKTSNPVRLVREALGKSQSQFARMFGVSQSFIQAIELGKRPMNDDLADAIAVRVGVRPDSLKHKVGIPTAMLFGAGAGLKDQIAAWEKNATFLNDDAVDNLRDNFVPMLEVLAEAAMREKKGVVLSLKLSRWIDATTADLGLNGTIKVVTRKKKSLGTEVDWRPYFLERSLNADGTGTLSFMASEKATSKLKRLAAFGHVDKPGTTSKLRKNPTLAPRA